MICYSITFKICYRHFSIRQQIHQEETGIEREKNGRFIAGTFRTHADSNIAIHLNV